MMLARRLLAAPLVALLALLPLVASLCDASCLETRASSAAAADGGCAAHQAPSRATAEASSDDLPLSSGCAHHHQTGATLAAAAHASAAGGPVPLRATGVHGRSAGVDIAPLAFARSSSTAVTELPHQRPVPALRI